MRRSGSETHLFAAFLPEANGVLEAVRRSLSNSRVRVSPIDPSRHSDYRRWLALILPNELVWLAKVRAEDLAAVTDVLLTSGAKSIVVTNALAIPDPQCQDVGLPTSVRDLKPFVKRLRRRVQDSRDYLTSCARLGRIPSPAAQWVIDNAYSVPVAIAALEKEIRDLPKPIESRIASLLKIARDFIAGTHTQIKEEALADFLNAVQAEREMTSAELWAFPLFLRVALIEKISEVACRSAHVQEVREAASVWADRMHSAAAISAQTLTQLVQRLDQEPFVREGTFAVALTEGLQDQDTALEAAQSLLEHKFGGSTAEMVRSEHEKESADALLASNSFGSLKTFAQIDYRTVFEFASRADSVLQSDPAGVYARSNFQTRDHCRQVVASIARRAHKPESEVAKQSVALAQATSEAPANGVLYYLFGDGQDELEKVAGASARMRQRIIRLLRRNSTVVYMGSNVILSASLLAIAITLAWDAGIHQPALLTFLGCLAIFPISELAIQIVHSLLINTFPPRALPKMDFKLGVPDDAATLVVVPMMLAGNETIRKELEKLEIRYLANRQRNLTFSLFSDFLDSTDRTASSDALLFEEARAGIGRLNRKYSEARFVLFHRPRSWSKTQRSWIGRERKRGKIEELNALLCGHGNPSIVAEGQVPASIRYVIALDADTQLPPDAALRLIETIAHPSNRVEIDPATGIRRAGYTIIQPRVGIALPGATASRFTRAFSDSHGTDAYSMVVSDAQQDLCGEAIFHGKAIYDVQAFDRMLANRFPSETILSHDLIEGAHVGVGFASDVELLEGLPIDYPGFAKRQHRWIRGDWQIAPWIRGTVTNGDGERVPNPLSMLNRWRILDNLRRSMVPIASMLLVAFGWFFSVAPQVWSVVLALTVGIPALVPILDRWTRHVEGSVHSWRGAADDLVRAALMIAFLPHQAWISLDAIVRAYHRRLISKANLLEWQTADAAQSNAGSQLGSTMREMLVIAALSALALLLLALEGSFAPTFLFLGVWIAAPWIMRWLGGRGPAPWRETLDEARTNYLRILARRTWRYFDDLVNAESNWLPPDNSQVALRVEVATRTSPTNIGLWLNSALSAMDFGYVTAEDFIRRCEATMSTLGKLARYEGHLLNWYDTQTLKPLPPDYVSTVDSGNLIASLWVLARGCNDLVRCPILGPNAVRGLGDTVDVLRSAAGADPALPVPIQLLRETLGRQVDGSERVGQLRLLAFHSDRLKAMKRWSPRSGDETTYWALKLAGELDSWGQLIDRYLAWMEILSGPADAMVGSMGTAAIEQRRAALRTIPSLQEIAEGPPAPLAQLLQGLGRGQLRPEVREWLEAVGREYEQSRRNAIALVEDLNRLASQVTSFAEGIRMNFLYDPARRLFGIGYLVGNPVVFTSHYDLLGSECRLASLVAIGKGDVPVEHWFNLGRPRAARTKHRGLLSWSGTMFEYLMPTLYTEMFEGTLLAHACSEAVDAQIAYAKRHNVPWGISEAAYSALDSNHIYQYRAFGVPELALNPNADAGPVVSPYSTVLALQIQPQSAYANLRWLEGSGLMGAMGFYESIDYTRPKDETDRDSGVPIYCYMAHHQGMSLVALGNLLNDHAMQRRFHSDFRIRAVESLLYERVPIVDAELAETAPAAIPLENAPAPDRHWNTPTEIPKVHLNSNGRLSIMVTNNGGGYCRWKNFDITRWRADSALDCWGSWMWLKDIRTGQVWSATPKPSGRAGAGSVTFGPDRAEFTRIVDDVEAKLEVAVATQEDAELRRATISNRSLRTKQIEITSFAELALAPHGADVAHPVFSKMFIETEYVDGVLLAHRRLRSPEDPPLWVASVLVGFAGEVQFETDRRAFVGRTGSPNHPDALDSKLTGTAGAVLDPIFSFRLRLRLEPREQQTFCIVTVAGSSRQEVLDAVHKYQPHNAVSQAFEMIWNRTQLEFRFLRIGPAAAHRYQELASYVLYPTARLRPLAYVERNLLGQNALWKYGISGDRPIVAVTVDDDQGTGLIRELLLAHSYWRMLGLGADLVILNREAHTYDAPVRKNLDRLVHSHTGWPSGIGEGEVLVVDWHSLLPEERTVLLATARVVLSGQRGTLQQQLLIPTEVGKALPIVKPVARPTPDRDVNRQLAPLALQCENGIGGFTAGGHEYVIHSGAAATPAPWANVMANPSFGCVVTESGLGFTWSGNSQMNRLTPWNNDPVADPQSEAIYLRDNESGSVWGATPLPLKQAAPFQVRHGQGYSCFEHNSHGISHQLTVFVARAHPIKVCRLQLTNDSGRVRNLSATYCADLVLGPVSEQQAPHIVTRFDEETGALLARQSWVSSFASKVAVVAAHPAPSSFTADRRAFWGRSTSDECPAQLLASQLDNRYGAGLDPCAALQVRARLAPGETREIVFLLGQAASEDEARALVQRFAQDGTTGEELAQVTWWWNQQLDVLHVETPAAGADLLLNRWLLYQSLSCRIWARSAIYQSGGAIGFRDQLQDCLALIYAQPALTRAHILKAAARQFKEGDVQHWWHVESGLGVRTRCSDDLLWLPWVVARYLDITQDVSILEESVPFLDGPALADDQLEMMFMPDISPQSANLFEHCVRAIEQSTKVGQHGLPLMGNGDWNDGMNHVGAGGKGESVWLAWFLVSILDQWAPLSKDRDPALTARWQMRSKTLAEAVEREAWDGDWYVRAFFDDGSPLGSRRNQEAQIDSLPQSWAVLSGRAKASRAQQALASAKERLVRPADGIALLFTPPFDHSTPHPGYIMGYPPGMRENGGQYTHAAIWLAQALARNGDGDAAVELLQMINPVERTSTADLATKYRGEPYAVAADVSSSAGRVGAANWTWYTGSAGWMYRVWIEDVLGFRLSGSLLRLEPCIPAAWPGYSINYRFGTSLWKITVERAAEVTTQITECDEHLCDGGIVRLVDDGQNHSVRVRIGVPTVRETAGEPEPTQLQTSQP